MKTQIITAIMLAALLLIAVNSTFGNGFTYYIESVPDTGFSKEMNRLGADGWELVFARRAKDSDSDSFAYEMIFKRHCGFFCAVAQAADTATSNAVRPTAR
jgi:hypothetical protein